MLAKFMIVLSVLPILLVWGYQHDSQVQPGPPDFCLKGPYHKAAPSIEDQYEFQECLSWSQDVSCCSATLTESISLHKARELYNFSWDLCGPLSPQCEKFIKDEECFYQCEPMLGYFQIGMSGYIQNVPVCASYCDAWFEACKDDLTCVENWLHDFTKDANGTNICPVNSSCITFQEMYGSGKGVCNKMWGEAFSYSNDTDNCTVMTFDGSTANPNTRLSFQGVPPDVSDNGSVQLTEMYGSVLFVMLLIAANI